MKTLNHPNSFKEGSRVLLLVGRNKDKADTRVVLRTSHDVEEFEKRLNELQSIANENERVYATANARNVSKAARHFKQLQLDSEYDRDPLNFYRRLESRWARSLMQENVQVKENKLWMFDCDYEEDVNEVLSNCGLNEVQYDYNTKSGRHIFVKPFNRKSRFLRVQNILHPNPIMLWSY